MATTTALSSIELKPGPLSPGGSQRLPPVLWRDPHSVPPEELAETIKSLELACAQDPANPDLRTCLGMAHAMNYDPYRSMDALEEARKVAPQHFLAQAKYAELHYRLRALDTAETETIRALSLATSGWEVAMMRRQLSEIRRLVQEGNLKPTWKKSLTIPVIGLGMLFVVTSLLFMVTK